MAWGRGHVEHHKRDSKFDSFLKRSLSYDAFERVRAYESCVVTSEKENKAFKFIVLSDDRLYITENPPKTIEEAVHLKDVIAVELVNEFPEFLQGKERANTQHIAVTYWTSEPRRRSYRRSKKSPRGSVTDLSVDRNSLLTPLGYANSIEGSLQDLGYLTQSSNSLPPSRPTSRGSITAAAQAKKKKKSQGLNDSHEHDSNLRSLKEVQEEETMDTSEEANLPSSRSALPSRGLPASLARQRKIEKILPGKNVSSNVVSRAKAADLTITTPLDIRSNQPRINQKETLQESKPPLLNDNMSPDKKVTTVGCCFFKRSKSYKNQIVPSSKSVMTNGETTLGSKTDPKVSLISNNSSSSWSAANQILLVPSMPPPSRGSSIMGSRSGTPLFDADRNQSQLSFSDMGSSLSIYGHHNLSVDGVLGERRKCVLNIYILNLTSPLLMLIKSAWNSYIIKSTMALEPENIEISTDPKILSAKIRDQMEQEFLQLKRNLFKTTLTIEEQFSYIDQFHKDAKSHFLLKKLFWKHSEMFTYFISQLQKYIPHTQAALKTHEGKVQRADEIELCILILSTLNLMFRESEILPNRLATIKLEGGKFLSELLKIMVSQPEFPYQPINLSKHWTTPIHVKKGEKPHQNIDEELVRLKAEFTKTVISALFELFLVAKQTLNDDLDLLSVPGIIAFCNQLKATEHFVDNLVSQIMELVTLSRFEMLGPAQCLLVFQMFTVLLAFLEENKSVIGQLRNSYYEEFKYFIQAPAMSKKMPPSYPITAPSIGIIDQVVTKVLGSQAPLSFKDIS